MEKSKVMMDTSAYVAFLRGGPGVKETVQQADEIVFNPVVLGEWVASSLMGRNKKCLKCAKVPRMPKVGPTKKGPRWGSPAENSLRHAATTDKLFAIWGKPWKE